jgi:hypothetical protein
MPNAPLYNIGDIIYLKESAAIGKLESYRIDNIIFDSSVSLWMYQVDVRQRGSESRTVLDAYNLSQRRILFFKEPEVGTFCDVIDTAITAHENRLTLLNFKANGVCLLDSSSSSEFESSSSSFDSSSSSSSSEQSSSSSSD